MPEPFIHIVTGSKKLKKSFESSVTRTSFSDEPDTCHWPSPPSSCFLFSLAYFHFMFFSFAWVLSNNCCIFSSDLLSFLSFLFFFSLLICSVLISIFLFSSNFPLVFSFLLFTFRFSLLLSFYIFCFDIFFVIFLYYFFPLFLFPFLFTFFYLFRFFFFIIAFTSFSILCFFFFVFLSFKRISFFLYLFFLFSCLFLSIL